MQLCCCTIDCVSDHAHCGNLRSRNAQTVVRKKRTDTQQTSKKGRKKRTKLSDKDASTSDDAEEELDFEDDEDEPFEPSPRRMSPSPNNKRKKSLGDFPAKFNLPFGANEGEVNPMFNLCAAASCTNDILPSFVVKREDLPSVQIRKCYPHLEQSKITHSQHVY